METVTTICAFLVMCGTGQTNAYSKPEIYNHGDNANVLIETLPTDGSRSLEIFFSSFTKKLHVIHMIIMRPNSTNEDDIQVNRHYSCRIKDINMTNGSLTFLLLNLNLMDSGNYTVFEGSLEKGKQSILVTRRILSGQVSKQLILPFMCNNTNTTSIKIGMNHVFDYVDYIIYDVARKSFSYTNLSQDYKDRIDSYVLNDTNFNLIFRELTWSDKGAYTAWDDQGLLLDFIFVGIADNNISRQQDIHSTDSSRHNVENGKTLWLLVSSVVVIIFAALLVIVTVRKIRQNKVPKTTINNLMDRNGNPNTTDSSRNRHFEEATSPEESEMNLTNINNANDPADFTTNKSNENVTSNEKHYDARGLNSKSPTRTTSKLQIHYSVSSVENFQSETTHGYNSTRKCAKLKTECLSDKPHLSSTKSIAGPSFEYDYLVQGNCITSRARAPDPVVTKQKKGKVMTDYSIILHRKEDKTSLSKVDPSIVDTSVNKKRTKETHCTDSSAEQRIRDLNIELTAPRFFEFESAAFKYIKSRRAPQSLNDELPTDVYDDPSALEKEHRVNQSYGVLNGDLMGDSSVRPSRMSSVRTFMDEDCYDSLYSL